MTRFVWSIIVVIAILALAGCAGTGEVVHLQIKPLPSVTALTQKVQETVTVAVEPFEDLRQDKSRLGIRTHLGGGHTVFNVPEGKVGEAVAQVVADYLKQIGFQVRLKQPGAPAPTDNPDITITGQIQHLSVHAKSRFLSTVITAKARVVLQAVNASDRSTVRLNLDGAREDTVFWFDHADAQEVVNRMLKDNMDKLLADTTVRNRTLMMK